MESKRQLPSIVWILIVVGGIAALIGSCIGSFYLMSEVEGFASMGMLVAAWVTIRVYTTTTERENKNPDAYKVPSATKAVFIIFFAVMGLAIDQTGNYVYNKPLEWLFCPANMELERGTEVTNPVPGETYITQDFTCINHDRQVVKELGFIEIIGVHFVEYILVGYGLFAVNGVYTRLRRWFRSAFAAQGADSQPEVS